MEFGKKSGVENSVINKNGFQEASQNSKCSPKQGGALFRSEKFNPRSGQRSRFLRPSRFR